MVDVSTASCDVISCGGIAIVLFTFPVDGQSWAYDYKNDTWVRWGTFNKGTGTHGQFIGQHSCFAKAWNKHLIQSSQDGKIYIIDRNLYTDSERLMVTYRRTGWIDQGVWKRKRIAQLFIKGKVFPRDSHPPSELMLRWRDDGSPVWSNWVILPLNPDQQGNFIHAMNRMGLYRSRQYEFRISSPVDFALVGANEDVEVMRN